MENGVSISVIKPLTASVKVRCTNRRSKKERYNMYDITKIFILLTYIHMMSLISNNNARYIETLEQVKRDRIYDQ